MTVVEWAHLIEEQLPNEYIQINIYHENETTRKILVKAMGSRYVEICKELFKR